MKVVPEVEVKVSEGVEGMEQEEREVEEEVLRLVLVPALLLQIHFLLQILQQENQEAEV